MDAEAIAAIERSLDETTRSIAVPENLRGAIRYALLGGGKRLRPLLAWHACEACGAPGERSLPAAVAVELVHTFSLVHDDLPAMDDDDLRRGRPTLHVHAGEAMAILAGDAMLSLAFGVLAERAEPRAAARLAAELSRGTTAMIGGQVYDTLGGFGEGVGDRARVETVHGNKTAALIRAACRMGAVCAGADGERVEMLSRYGESLGLLFQVVDDLLDVESTSEQAGKRTRKDAEAGKLTYPGVFGVEESKREVARLRGEAVAAVAGLGPAAEPLRSLCVRMASRDR